MAIATITAANLLSKLSVTSVTGLDSIRVTLTSGNEATELASLLNAFNNDTAPMLIGVGLQVRLGDGTTVITFAKDGNGVFKAYNGAEEYTGTLASDMLNVFNAFYADRLPSIAEINQKLAVDLNGAISDIAQVQTAIADLPDIRNAIGQQDNPNTTENEATGLYAAIENVVAQAVQSVEAQIATVTQAVTSNTGAIADNLAAIQAIQSSLATLEGVVGNNDLAIRAMIGEANTSTTEISNATGIYAAIENAVAQAVQSVEAQIATVTQAVTSNTGAIADNLAAIQVLQSDLSSIASILGQPSMGQTPSSGLFMTVESLSGSLSSIADGLANGYLVAKSDYDSALFNANASKAIAEQAMNDYVQASSQVTDVVSAQAALDKAEDFYAAAYLAKTDADNLVDAAKAVYVAATQTVSTEDDQLVINVKDDAIAMQQSAANLVISANGSVNTSTLVLSNVTLDASNQVIVSFIDYSSAAAATSTDVTEANTAKQYYQSALDAYNQSPSELGAYNLLSAATNFKAADQAASTASIALQKANDSSLAADTTMSTSDDAIADTNLSTATSVKAGADELKTQADYAFALGSARANIPEIQALSGNGSYHAGFAVTSGASVSVVIDGVEAIDLPALFEIATLNNVDTYIPLPNAFDGTEAISVGAVMHTMIGTESISSFAVVLPSLTLDTTAPVTPNATLTTDSTGDSGVPAYALDGVTNDASITAPLNSEAGGTVEYNVLYNGLESGWNATYTAPVTDGTVDGVYAVQVRQLDEAGNVSDIQTINFTLDSDADADTNALTLILGTDTANAQSATSIPFSVTGIDSDAVAVSVEFDDGDAQTANVIMDATNVAVEWLFSGAADLSTLSDGQITATVSVVDAAGNTATHQDTLNLTQTPASIESIVFDGKSEVDFDQLNQNDIVSVAVNMTSPVTIDTANGSPILTLTMGTTPVNAIYDAVNSTSTKLVFTYQIGATDNDADGISIAANALALNGAIIVDGNGNTIDISSDAVADNSDYIVDTVMPIAGVVTAFSYDSEVDSATGGNDFVTNTAVQTVSGTYTHELLPGEVIQVSAGSDIWVNAIATPYANPALGGTWTTEVDAITLELGSLKSTSVRTVDLAGNIQGGAGFGYTLDIEAPLVTISNIEISADTGVSNADFNTQTASQTITATLSTTLGTDESLWGSLDDGATWTDLTASVSSTTLTWAGATLSGSSVIQLQVRDIAGNAGATAEQAYVVDAVLPSATVTLTSVMDNVGGIQADIIGSGSATTDDTSLTLAGAITGAVDVANGEAVVIYDGPNRLGEATISMDGLSWSFTESREVTGSVLNDGYVANYSAVVEDLAGNKSVSTGNTFDATISTAPITSTATITAIADDASPVTGNITDGAAPGQFTNDTIPVLSGDIVLGATLTELPVGQVVAVYDGTTKLGNATISETAPGSGVFTWSFTDEAAPLTPRLFNGNTANYTVVIENTSVGTQGTPSDVFVLNIDTQVDPTSEATLDPNDDTGEYQNDGITNQTTGLTLTGTGEVGATVKFYVRTDDGMGGYNYTAIQDGSLADVVATVDAMGNFTADIDLASAPTTPYQIVTQQTDRAGNVSDYSVPLMLTIDTQADTSTSSLALLSIDDSFGGSVLIQNNDGRTNVTENLTITGAGVEGSTVQLYTWTDDALTPDGIVQDSELTLISNASAKIESGTSFSIDLPTMSQGTHKIVAKQTDVAGNVSVASTAYTLVVDTTIATPTVSLTNDTGIGGNNSDLYTNSAALTFSTAADDVTRTFKIDSGSATESYTPPTTAGTYTVTVTDTDKAGNTANTSINFTLDVAANAPSITGLTNDTGSNSTDKTTKDMTLTLSGVEEGALVEYQVNSSGTWLSESVYLALADGTYSVQVRQTDKAGNVSAASTALTGIVKDTAAPAAVTFTIDDNGTNTTDGVTSNAVVNISKADDVVKWEYTLNGTAGTPTWVEGTGTNFSLGTTDAMFAVNDIQVRGYDLAGNMTTATSNTMAYRLDKTAPMAATGTSVKHYDSNGDVKTGDYVAGDYIEFLFNEQLSAAPTKVSGDGFGNTAVINLNDTATSALVQLKSGELIDGGETIVLQAIDLVGQQANISFTIPLIS